MFMDRHTEYSIVKTSVFPNMFCRFSAILLRIPASCFLGINKVISKLTWKGKRPGIANIILKENKAEGLILASRVTINL